MFFNISILWLRLLSFSKNVNKIISLLFSSSSRIPNAGLGYRADEAPVQLTRRTQWGKRWDKISVSKNAIMDRFISYYNQIIGVDSTTSSDETPTT